MVQIESPADEVSFTEIRLTSRGKPVPEMVSVSPPRALAGKRDEVEMTRGTLMSATPVAYGRRPEASLISALWSPALGAFFNVH